MEKVGDEKQCFKGLSSHFSGPLVPSLFNSLPFCRLSPPFRGVRQIVFTMANAFMLVDGGIAPQHNNVSKKLRSRFLKKQKKNKQPMQVINQDSLPWVMFPCKTAEKLLQTLAAFP